MPTFTRLAEVTARGTLVKPLLHQFAMSDDVAPINIIVDRPVIRGHDGWFHASQHPLGSAYELYQWMTARSEPEDMNYTSRMSVMFGSCAHGIMEAFLAWAGIAEPLPQGDCPACGRPYRPLRARPDPRKYCTEHGFRHDATRARCHLDSILRFGDGIRRGFDFKCLAPETMVSMADGSLTPAGKISAGDMIVGWDEEVRALAPRRVLHAWDNGIAPVVKVRTRGGREITVTDEHPLLTKRGWVRAADLIPFSSAYKNGRHRSIPHDSIRTAWGCEWWTGPDGDEDEASLLGLLVGDGCLTQNRVTFTNCDPGVNEFVASYASRFGCNMTPTGSRKSVTHYISARRGANGFNGGNHFLTLLRKEDLMGKGAREKRVPPSVWTGGPRSWAGFLSGYLDADGSVRSDPGSYPLVKWSSVNRGLLLDCQVLLSYLGVKSSVNIHRSRYKGADHVSWDLWVRDARSVERLRQVLRPHHSLKREALAALMPATRADGKFIRDNLEWDPVVEVVRQLDQPTVAIEVDGHTHVTSGLVTHNTIHQFGLKGVRDMDLDCFRDKWPGYWAQGQECMRLSGLRRYIFLFMTLGNPWETREFHFDFDPEFAMATEQKYLDVISHLERGVPIVG